RANQLRTEAELDESIDDRLARGPLDGDVIVDAGRVAFEVAGLEQRQPLVEALLCRRATRCGDHSLDLAEHPAGIGRIVAGRDQMHTAWPTAAGREVETLALARPDDPRAEADLLGETAGWELPDKRPWPGPGPRIVRVDVELARCCDHGLDPRAKLVA